METLGSLTGSQDGPTDKFLDGTRFEYDSTLRRTVEVAPSGKRFPVALVAGEFNRDAANASARKTVQ
jgi:phage baseplate assembly protein gpV